MQFFWRALLRGESGQDLVEYAVLVCSIVPGVVAAVKALSNSSAAVSDHLLNELIASW